MARLEGRIAVVTGGSQGIGKSTVEALAAEGARVVVADRKTTQGEELAQRLTADGADVSCLRLDVTDEAQWSQLADTVRDRFGRMDILVNCAGVWFSSDSERVTRAEFDRIVDVNLWGVVLGIKHSVPLMRLRADDDPSASIVNLSSIAGLVGSITSPLYSLTKGGVRLLSKSTALELARKGYRIRCNSIHPGSVETAMLDDIAQASGLSSQEHSAFRAQRSPMGRDASPDEIARAIVFLSSEDASFITGSELVVDGGYTAE